MKHASKPTPAAQATVPEQTLSLVINPSAVFLIDQLRTALQLRASTLRREIRMGRLRVSKRGGKYFFLGEWVLQWLRTGEVQQRPKEGTAIESNGAVGQHVW